MQKSICITNLVRIANFAWIFARYWNGVNSNLQIASVTVATGKIEDKMLLQKRKRRSMEWMQISDKDMKKSP